MLLCLAEADCEAGIHDADDFLLNPRPGSFEMWDCRGELPSSGNDAMRSRGGGIRDGPLPLPLPLPLPPTLESLGWGLKVGRLEVGRGLARPRAGGEFLGAAGDCWLVILLIPEADEGGASRSLEAAGRKREDMISGAAARLSLDCDGRRAVGMLVDLGMGSREVGRGRALLPAWNLLSSMVYCCSARKRMHHKLSRRRGWWATGLGDGRATASNGE